MALDEAEDSCLVVPLFDNEPFGKEQRPPRIEGSTCFDDETRVHTARHSFSRPL